MSDYKPPEPIQEFYKKKDMAEKILYSRKILHKKAFMAISEHLKDDKNLYEPERIKDAKVRSDMENTLVQFYMDAAKEEYGFDVEKTKWDKPQDEDPVESAKDYVLRNLYLGVDRSELSEKLKEFVHQPYEFTDNNYLEKVPGDEHGRGSMRGLEMKLQMNTIDHLTEDHVDHIYDHLNRDNALKGLIEKGQLVLRDAATLLHQEYELDKKGVKPTSEHYKEIINKGIPQFRQEQAPEPTQVAEDMQEVARTREPEWTIEDIEREIAEVFQANEGNPDAEQKARELLEKKRNEGLISEEVWQEFIQRQQQLREMQMRQMQEQMARQQSQQPPPAEPAPPENQ